jgi:hypothetical protein
LALTITTAAGCLGSRSVGWKPVELARDQRAVAAALPSGWFFFDDKAADPLILTRYGAHMDIVRVTQNGKLPFKLPYTELPINAGMQPYEAAEAVVNNLLVTPGVFDLTMEELAPAEIDGADAFRLSLSYSIENGMRRRALIFGAIHGDHNYYTEMAMYAHEDYYFDAVIGDFLALVNGYKIK